MALLSLDTNFTTPGLRTSDRLLATGVSSKHRLERLLLSHFLYTFHFHRICRQKENLKPDLSATLIFY